MIIIDRRYTIGLFVLLALFVGWTNAQEIRKEQSTSSKKEKDSRLSIEGEIQQSVGAYWNFNLDDDDEEGILVLEPTAEFGIEYALSKDTRFYLNMQYGRELEIEEEDSDRKYKSSLEVDEGFVQFDEIFTAGNGIKKTSLTLGRFKLGDSREWYYDKSLDGLLWSFEVKPIDTQFEFSINREELFGSDLLRHNDFDPVNNFILAVEHKPFKAIEIAFTAHTVVRDDRSDDNESPRFYGIGANGELADKRLNFWTEFAWARGTDDDEKIKGYGMDAGLTVSFTTDIRSYVTLAYAFGSGDGDTDSDFRQTDLQGNSGKFGGVTSIKYYGEVLDPELSNMHIFTAGLGFRFSRTASVDFLYHLYQQDKALDELRNGDIDTDPEGDDRNLGKALDIVFGFNVSSNTETEIVLGYFQPGSAFDVDTEGAYLLEARLTYNF